MNKHRKAKRKKHKEQRQHNIVVTGCSDCPFNKYIGGPHICFIINEYTPKAWLKCPLKKGPVTVTTSGVS